MENTTEKKLPVRNLERIVEHKFNAYEQASMAAQRGPKDYAFDGETLRKGDKVIPVAKVKIFARNDSTFDVVWYQKIGAEKPQVVEAAEVKVEEAQHGLRAKDRRKKDRK